MKKLLTFLVLCISFMLILTACGGSQTPSTDSDNSSETEPQTVFNVDGVIIEIQNGEFTVIGYDGESSDVVIPESHNGVTVTSIANNAFANVSQMASISISESVTYIGGGAFQGCSALKNITISQNVEYIGEAVFSGCSSIESITVPFLGSDKNASNATLSHLFGYDIPRSLKSVTITTGNKLADDAFKDCKYLTSVTLPSTLKTIGQKAFSGCSGIMMFSLPEGVTEIGNEAFTNCEGITEFVIPSTVVRLGAYTFSGCVNLNSLAIPASVEEIGNEAFANCTAMTEFVIPDTVEIVGTNLFNGNPSLKKITLGFLGTEKDIPVTLSTLVGYDAASSIKTVIINGGSILADSAFEGCKNLVDVTLPETLKTIGANAFMGCSKITEIVIPDKVTEIGSNAFRDCKGIEEIIIPDKVVKINSRAFMGCTSLESIVISTSVEEIGNNAFEGCTALIELVIPDNVTRLGSCILKDCASLEKLTVPFLGTSIEDMDREDVGFLGYFFANVQKAYHTYNSDSQIPMSLKTVVLNGGTVLAKRAFACCEYLTSVELPDTIKTIGVESFRECKNITAFDIPESVTIIEAGAFFQCPKITEIVIPDGVIKLGNSFAAYCTNLKNVVIPNSVDEIGEQAFRNCISLKEIVIPDSVQKIGQQIFWECSALEKITVPFLGATRNLPADSVVGVLGYFFKNHSIKTDQSILHKNQYSEIPSSLKDVVITDDTVICKAAFYDCNFLITVTLPNSIMHISQYGFDNVAKIEKVIFNGTKEQWGKIVKDNASITNGITIQCTDGDIKAE